MKRANTEIDFSVKKSPKLPLFDNNFGYSFFCKIIYVNDTEFTFLRPANRDCCQYNYPSPLISEFERKFTRKLTQDHPKIDVITHVIGVKHQSFPVTRSDREISDARAVGQ